MCKFNNNVNKTTRISAKRVYFTYDVSKNTDVSLDLIIIYLKSLDELPFFHYLISIDYNTSTVRVLLMSEKKFNVKDPNEFNLAVKQNTLKATYISVSQMPELVDFLCNNQTSKTSLNNIHKAKYLTTKQMFNID